MKSLLLFVLAICLLAPISGCQAKQDDEKPADVLSPADQQKQGGPHKAVPTSGGTATGNTSTGTK